MSYCPSCGAEIGDHLEYCPSCGAQINAENKAKMAQLDHDEIQMAKPGHAQFQQELPRLVQRNYLVWFLLTILTGFIGLVYIYFVFDDLKNLDKYPKPAGVKSTAINQNTIIIVIILYLLGLSVIANYIINGKKYGMFNDYLDTHPQKQMNLPSKNYIKLMIFRDIIQFIGYGFLLAGFFILYASAFESAGGYISITNIGPLSSLMALSANILAIVFFSLGSIFYIPGLIIAIYMIVLDFRWQEAMNERVRIIDPNFITKDFL